MQTGYAAPIQSRYCQYPCWVPAHGCHMQPASALSDGVQRITQPRCAAAYNGNLNARRGSRCAAAPMRMRPHARCDQTAAETLRLSGGVKRDCILLRTRDIKEVRRTANRDD